MAKNNGKEHIKNLNFFGIPFGKIMSKRSFFADDEVSEKGIKEAKDVILNSQEGMAVFFAHLGLLDAFGTVAVMERELPEFDSVFPAAGSWYHFPILNSIFKKMNTQVPYEFTPVFRKEDFGRMKLHVKVIDFSGLSDEEKKQANKRYVARSQEIIKKPGGVVVLNPYAGRAPKLEYLRSGPLKLLQSGKPIMLSLTMWNWKKLKYDVYFSEVLKFKNDITQAEAHDIIFAEYMRMADLSGISKKQVLESKSGSPAGKAIWSVIALVLSAYLLSRARRIKKRKNN